MFNLLIFLALQNNKISLSIYLTFFVKFTERIQSILDNYTNLPSTLLRCYVILCFPLELKIYIFLKYSQILCFFHMYL